MRLKSFVIVAAIALVGGQTMAALIPENGQATASSQLVSGFQRGAVNAYNGSGLSPQNGSAFEQHVNYPDGTMWESTGAGYGGVDTNPYFQVDLGAVYNVTSFHIWNFNEGGNTSRGVGNVEVLASTTSATPTIADLKDSIFVPAATGGGNYTGTDFAGPSNAFTARYVQFKILSNQGDLSSFYGLSEVQFQGSLAPTPEPATLGIAAFGGLLMMRRRRAAQ